jgi:hypothetical protein
MKKPFLSLSLTLLAGIASAQSPAPTDKDGAPPAPPARPAPADGPMVYGWQLMSDEERAAYRAQMRAMSAEEREKFQQAHHEAMKARAKERGVSLPDQTRTPPGAGKGRGPAGTGPGPGAGQRGGGGRPGGPG